MQGVETMDYKRLGNILKLERTRLNYKQSYIADKIGVCQRYISKIEGGVAKPEFAKVYEIAQILGLSLDYLAEITFTEQTQDQLSGIINIRLQMSSLEEKNILLKAIEYYIVHIKGQDMI